MTKSSENEYSDRLELWNSLSDTSNDKIKYFALFDGDEEKAKWAFIRDGVKAERQTKFSAPEFFNISDEGPPTLAKKILSGNIPFWRWYLALIVAPNFLYRLALNGWIAHESLKFSLAFYYAFTIFAVILLTASAMRLNREKNRYAKIALGLMLLSAVSIAYQTPTTLEVLSEKVELKTLSEKLAPEPNSTLRSVPS